MLEQLQQTQHLQRSLFIHNEKNPFHCTEELFSTLKEAINKKTPFSLIRLGDGEGRILAYPRLFEDDVFISQVLTYQFGKEVIGELKKEIAEDFLAPSMLKLQSLIKNSILNADVIGAPSWLHFREAVNEKNIIAQTAQSVCLQSVDQLVSKDIPIFDHFIFKPFNKSGFFKRLLENLDCLTVISHTDISDTLVDTFDLKSCNHIKIPGHQSFMKSGEFHFPTRYKEIENEIQVPDRGHLFFVAAGYLGKHYCNIIKQKGGIAIDIGSIFDGWTGLGRPDATANEEQRLKKPRKLYIHMGHHKTGTTSLQFSLVQSENQLKEAGISFLKHNKSGNSSELISVSAARSRITTKLTSTFYNLIREAPEGDGIISAEHLSFIENEAVIEELAMECKKHFDDVVVICYLRRQDKLAISLKQQAAKQPFSGASPSSALCGHDNKNVLPPLTFTLFNYLNFEQKVQKWQRVFGANKVVIRVYDKEVLHEECICADFSKLLKLKTPLKTINVNDGLGAVKTKIKHLLLETKAPSEIIDYFDKLKISDGDYELRKVEHSHVNFMRAFAEINNSFILDSELLSVLSNNNPVTYYEPEREVEDVVIELLLMAENIPPDVRNNYIKLLKVFR
ncbi:GT-D fold domain-containing protein [Aliiglaciecola lipolytica]|uniref:GT-D fold domain-containing protein n=1 Tax=Aliiglaciecola lipolytica TaxID=477689 RepID=UPI001C0A261F|nr:hypothetical protein [Aliiglaciecola lipolytica]MBU2877765.1 hypothetical protein [Aliiglaciecola lipolytica]